MKAHFIPSEGSSRLEAAFLNPDSTEMRGDGLARKFLEGRESDKRDGLEGAFLREANIERGLIEVENFERSWHERRPEIPEDRNLHGGDLKQSFHALLHHPKELADFAYATDSTLAKHIDRIAPQMAEANALGDSAQVSQLSSDLYRGASGRYSEFMVETVLSQYFDKVVPQHRSMDGKTIMDVFCEGARSPMNFGKEAFVPKGGTMAAEVKAAKPNYFRSELEGGHLHHQVQGHRVADAGIVITTRDMKEAYLGVSKDLQDSARASLREAGSPLFCFLPPKETIDRTMMDLLERRMKQLPDS